MTVTAFPLSKATPPGQRLRTEEPCSVVILPTVRIERYEESAEAAFEALSPSAQKRAARIMKRYTEAKRDAEAT